MKKTVVLLISVILITIFSYLVFYGLRNARGVPAKIEIPPKVQLEVPYIEKQIDLSYGISKDFWETLKPKEIGLLYQVMVLPWGKSLMSPISVKAFHNKKDIYFYLEWKDQTENRDIEANKFSDAAAIMFPIGDKILPSTIMMGFMAKSNIWQWKASQDKEYWHNISPQTDAYSDYYYKFEEAELFPVSKSIPKSAVNDLMAVRIATLTPKPNQNVYGRGIRSNGTWKVVFKRSLNPSNLETDPQFLVSQKRLCAFAVWNGENGDRGGRKSISNWVEVVIK